MVDHGITEPVASRHHLAPTPPPGRPVSDLAREVGIKIRLAREGAGLSQDALAHALGYRAAMISAFEAGKRRLKVEDLAALCRALDRPPDYFLPFDEDLRRSEGGPVIDSAQVGVMLRAELQRLPDSLSEQVVGFLDHVEHRRPVGGAVPDLGHLQPSAAAAKVLQMCGVKEPPVMLRQVWERLSIPVAEWKFPDSLSALLARTQEGGYVIGVNQGHPWNRRRFSAAHEIGHAVLRHDAAYYLEVADPSAVGEPPDYRYFDERAANAFAAALLMDERWLRRDFRRFPHTATLADRYVVSEEAMSFRLMNLGLT